MKKGKLLYFACVVTGQAIESGFPNDMPFCGFSYVVDGNVLL
jgi:hypothetical protein